MTIPYRETLEFYLDTSAISQEKIEEIFGKNKEDFFYFLDSKEVDEKRLKKTFSTPRLKKLAKSLDIPLSFLFLKKTFEKKSIIPDFRGGGEVISKELIKNIEDNKKRQDWLSEFFQKNAYPKFSELCPCDISSDEKIVQEIRKISGYYQGIELAECKKNLEKYQVMVSQSGVTNSKASIKDKIRGYAIFDEYAPLVFILSSDSKEGKIFTLMHELAHVFLRQGGISGDYAENNQEIEYRCNAIAGEVLMPKEEFLYKWELFDTLFDLAIEECAKHFRVSQLASATKAWLLGKITYKQYVDFKNSLPPFQKKEKSGGDYYTNIASHNGRLFSKMIIASTINGEETYRDAMRYLGIKSFDTMKELTQRVFREK